MLACDSLYREGSGEQAGTVICLQGKDPCGPIPQSPSEPASCPQQDKDNACLQQNKASVPLANPATWARRPLQAAREDTKANWSPESPGAHRMVGVVSQTHLRSQPRAAGVC